MLRIVTYVRFFTPFKDVAKKILFLKKNKHFNVLLRKANKIKIFLTYCSILYD